MLSFGDILLEGALLSPIDDIYLEIGQMLSFGDILLERALLSPMGDMVLRSTDELPSLVHARRRELGITQEALADLAGVHRTYISLFERGRRVGPFDTVLRILHTLGVDLEVRIRGQ
jgi:DNA-binding XRE family transcriptional regulator